MLSLVWAALLFCNEVVSIPIESKEGGTGDSRPQLQLTTFILNQRYCKGEKGSLAVLHIDLGLRYKNIGKNRLILYKFENTVNREMVSCNLEDASSKRYISDASVTVFTSGIPSVEEGPSPGEEFVALAPGSSFETKSSLVVAIPLKGGEDEKSKGALGPGEYCLQVNVSTWPASRSLAERLGERWRGVGDFWHHDITSRPMWFRVEEHPTLQDCSPFAELLQAAGTDPNARDRSGFTALMAAVYEHNEDLFHELLKKGADVNAKTNEGLTALIIAASRSDTDFLRELIEHGADVNAKTDDGDTALLKAVEKCDPEDVRLLVDSGADVDGRNKKGNTALMQARELCDRKDQRGIIKLLKQAAAKK